jgi:hypothetical protein
MSKNLYIIKFERFIQMIVKETKLQEKVKIVQQKFGLEK